MTFSLRPPSAGVGRRHDVPHLRQRNLALLASLIMDPALQRSLSRNATALQAAVAAFVVSLQLQMWMWPVLFYSMVFLWVSPGRPTRVALPWVSPGFLLADSLVSPLLSPRPMRSPFRRGSAQSAQSAAPGGPSTSLSSLGPEGARLSSVFSLSSSWPTSPTSLSSPWPTSLVGLADRPR